MPRFLIKVTIILSIFSACILRAEPSYNPEFFLKQKVSVYGLAGIPWEETSSIDEERSRSWMDALHHAYEQIIALPLMEGKQVRNVLQTNPALKQRLKIALLSAPKTFYEQDISGLVRCKVEVPFTGKRSIRSCLYLAALRPRSMKPVSFLASWSSGLRFNEDELAPEIDRVVVDLRDSYFEPSIFPRFFNQKGYLLFQEAMVPSPSRFSRPVVRYVTDISEAYEGLEMERIMVVEARVPELAKRDICLAQAESGIFQRFAKELVRNPDSKREIVIVFSISKEKTGKLSKIEKKEEKQNNKSK